eukprot:1159942-Pelagomonas_calceolata.AAC.12
MQSDLQVSKGGPRRPIRVHPSKYCRKVCSPLRARKKVGAWVATAMNGCTVQACGRVSCSLLDDGTCKEQRAWCLARGKRAGGGRCSILIWKKACSSACSRF